MDQMTFSPAGSPDVTLSHDPIGEYGLSYERQRFRNECFQRLMKLFADRAEHKGFTKQTVADRLNKDRGQVSRLFNMPSNWTLDTISDLANALHAEPSLTFLVPEDNERANFVHPWIVEFVAPKNLVDFQAYQRNRPSSVPSFSMSDVVMSDVVGHNVG